MILVGRPEGKTWWHNFESDHYVDVLMKGRWKKMTARAVVGRDEPEAIGSLLAVYAARFPKAPSCGQLSMGCPDRTFRDRAVPTPLTLAHRSRSVSS